MLRVKTNMKDAFERGTSHQEWCEQKYLHNDFVAEWYNTWTSLSFVVISIVQLWLLRPFEAVLPGTGIRWVWVLLSIVGVTSWIYHCTLSLAGQLLDEVSIIWVFLSVYAFILPRSSWLNFYPFYGKRWIWCRFW